MKKYVCLTDVIRLFSLRRWLSVCLALVLLLTFVTATAQATILNPLDASATSSQCEHHSESCSQIDLGHPSCLFDCLSSCCVGSLLPSSITSFYLRLNLSAYPAYAVHLTSFSRCPNLPPPK